MHRNPERGYRRHDRLRADEHKFQVVVEETDLWITIPAVLEREHARDTALETVLAARREIKFWCEAQPAFRHSLVPLFVPKEAPAIARHMAWGAEIMGVGPFAAVAGTIAQHVAESLAAILAAQNLPQDVMVENGGDTYIFSSRKRVVGLLPNPEEEESVGVVLYPGDFPLSLCASSGTIGHSLSFGQGELAVVRARDGALADAAATAYGNMLKGPDDVQRALAQAEKDARLGVEGVFFQCGGQIGVWGKMELAALHSSR